MFNKHRSQPAAIPEAQVVRGEKFRRRRGFSSYLCDCIERVITLACLGFIVYLIVTYFPDLFSNDTEEDFSSISAVSVSLDNVTRTDDDYIGIIFVTDVTASQEAAFVDAAHTWSLIIQESLDDWENSLGVDRGDTLCGEENVTASEDFSIDFLIILAAITGIDGVGGVLGAAGPCSFVSTSNNAFFPALGIMNFDSNDMDDLENEGTLETVILHEMAHVLGFGGLWSATEQGGIVTNPDPVLLIDEVIQDDGSFDLGNEPQFLGTGALEAYSAVTGDDEVGVPVEDGFTSGNRNSAGSGSLDAHWDSDALNGELMNFAISSGGSFPLSTITIGSLADQGYTVDDSLAEAFSTRSSVKKNLRGTNKVFYMYNDVLDITPEFPTI